MKKSLDEIADTIERAAVRMGYSVNQRFASTGTIYLTARCKDDACCDEFEIRVADHQDAYGTSDYTADNVEGTHAGSILFLAKNSCFENGAKREINRLRGIFKKKRKAEILKKWEKRRWERAHEYARQFVYKGTEPNKFVEPGTPFRKRINEELYIIFNKTVEKIMQEKKEGAKCHQLKK